MTQTDTHIRTKNGLSRFALSFLLATGLLLILAGCYNPFAPEESGLSSDVWDNQKTVGGLLRNLQSTYVFRDSLRYADLIARDFEFHYYNIDYGSYDNWGRDVELRATGGLMRNYLRLDLSWGPISTDIDTFSLPDSTIEFIVTFTLSADQESPISGFARFKAKSEDDGKFRLKEWWDDY